MAIKPKMTTLVDPDAIKIVVQSGETVSSRTVILHRSEIRVD